MSACALARGDAQPWLTLLSLDQQVSPEWHGWLHYTHDKPGNVLVRACLPLPSRALRAARRVAAVGWRPCDSRVTAVWRPGGAVSVSQRART